MIIAQECVLSANMQSTFANYLEYTIASLLYCPSLLKFEIICSVCVCVSVCVCPCAFGCGCVEVGVGGWRSESE